MPIRANSAPDRPVERVSWDDIQVFLTRLNEQQAENLPEGWAYVLPTEARWEYACRAGTTTAYSWGDTITASDANWNHGSDANRTEDVGRYSANTWGFYDMHGNVFEWTRDAYDSYDTDDQKDPLNPGVAGSIRVNRGGSWDVPGTGLRSAMRNYGNPFYRNHSLGFRLGLQNINEAPRDLNSTTFLAIAENQPIGTTVGEFNATDPEGHAVSYYLVNENNNNSLFTLDANGTLKTATTFDYESNASSFMITVQAKDELNATTEGNYTAVALLDDDTEDRDGDGFTDGQEAEAGTDPDSTASFPGLNYGLVAWYPFDGNASDMSGNGLHGVVNGATLGFDRNGHANKAYSFDGLDDLITVADEGALEITENLSVFLWYKNLDASSSPSLGFISKSDPNVAEGWRFWTENSNKLRVTIFGSSQSDLRPDGFHQVYNEWKQVGFVYSNQRVKAYQDASLGFDLEKRANLVIMAMDHP